MRGQSDRSSQEINYLIIILSKGVQLHSLMMMKFIEQDEIHDKFHGRMTRKDSLSRAIPGVSYMLQESTYNEFTTQCANISFLGEW